MEHTAAQGFVGQLMEPAFDQVQPQGRGRGEGHVDGEGEWPSHALRWRVYAWSNCRGSWYLLVFRRFSVRPCAREPQKLGVRCRGRQAPIS